MCDIFVIIILIMNRTIQKFIVIYLYILRHISLLLLLVNLSSCIQYIIFSSLRAIIFGIEHLWSGRMKSRFTVVILDKIFTVINTRYVPQKETF